MVILVTADNFLQMFVGWEGVGLCSYLLINFWFARIQANKAAIKAMLVNRVGDFGLALGIFAIFTKFQSIDYAVVFALAPTLVGDTMSFLTFEVDTLTCIGLLLFVGAVGKSAQIGLHMASRCNGRSDSSFSTYSRSDNGYRRSIFISALFTVD